MTYTIIPRTQAGLPATVKSSSGRPRPKLAGCRWYTAHYTGVSKVYANSDAAEVTRHIQQIFSASKPFEYSYVIGQQDDDQIIEFAGEYQAAHSGGENGNSIGVLFLLGVGEKPTDTMIKKWQWLRDVLKYTGTLAPDAIDTMHRNMPGAATACPGAGIRETWPSFLAPYQAPLPPNTHTNTGDTPMITLDEPIRLLDSRTTAYRLEPGEHLAQLPASLSSATSLYLTLTVVAPDVPGFAVVFAGDPTNRPNVSSLNYVAGQTVCNTTLTRVRDGKFWLFTTSPAHYIIDVLGYQQ